MKRKIDILLMFLGLIGTLAIVSACGGGGGGGGSSSTGDLTYSGVTTEAIITEENAVEIVSSALKVGTSGSSPSIVALSADEASLEPSAVAPAQVLLSIMRTVEIQSPNFYPPRVAPQAVQEESDIIYGGCGGNASLNMRIDDVTGSFTGTISYNNYCEAGETANGSANFSGQIDLDYLTFLSFSMNFKRLEVENYYESYAMSGNVDIDIFNDSVALSMDLVIRDDLMAKTYKVQDFMVNVAVYSNMISLEMSGRFYDPEYGYVFLSTPVIMQGGIYDNAPSTGQLLVTGRNLTSARLTVVNSTFYEVEADLDGNGSYELSSGLIAW